MTRLTALRRIVLPQGMRVIIPPVGNEFISMVKLTSVASVIQYSEILRNAQCGGCVRRSCQSGSEEPGRLTN